MQQEDKILHAECSHMILKKKDSLMVVGKKTTKIPRS